MMSHAEPVFVAERMRRVWNQLADQGDALALFCDPEEAALFEAALGRRGLVVAHRSNEGGAVQLHIVSPR